MTLGPSKYRRSGGNDQSAGLEIPVGTVGMAIIGL